ncbi:hypothetical protein NR402_01965 [Acidithiobacillus ferrooxidans]|uniref:hypothetical protein n=1 Tax=Acidithiobacillus ferrooxidans TaxID=920 RepID=UPI00214ADD13|nr:hypothetical protein [Acidithiobacillus ferrooxidans]MCR2829056.1 hypothetical protein [Acidithiobacillus ferrooxidans]
MLYIQALGVLVYFCFWGWLLGKRGTMDFFRAARYWMGRGEERHHGRVEDRALRYLSEVYGSGIDLPWVNCLMVGFGMSGCLAALIILVNSLFALYFPTGHFLPVKWLELVMIAGLFPPILVMFFGKWQKTVNQRRLGAVRRIFKSLDQAVAVACELRKQYSDASAVPSIWAFPVRPDYTVFEAGKSIFFAYAFLVLSSFYVAKTVPRFLETVILGFSLYFVPVVFHGVLAAFGGWSQKRADLMAYPVSVFLRDIRILEKQRKLLSFD